MSKRFTGSLFVSTALIALPAMAQPSFAPPPQVPYGVSIGTDSAKTAAAAAIAEAV